MHQLSLVAMYGEKDPRLQEVIQECNRIILQLPQIKYSPYDLRQVHATIISLERFGTTTINLNLSRYRNVSKSMDFNGLINALQTEQSLPFKVQIGGFKRNSSPFSSWGKGPFERSFQIQGNKAVMIGWPIKNDSLSTNYPDVLDKLRRSLQDFNVLHRYHASANDIDNDFYYRIGLLDSSPINLVGLEKTINDIRNYLASIDPIIIEINTSNICFVRYDDETLPINSTKSWTLSSKEITPHNIWSLYN